MPQPSDILAFTQGEMDELVLPHKRIRAIGHQEREKER